jgi:hypothetical protein
MKRHIFIVILLAALFAGCEDMMNGIDTGSEASVKPDLAAKFLADINNPAVTTITVTESLYVAGSITVDTPKTIVIEDGYTVSAQSLTVNADLTLNGAPIQPSLSARAAIGAVLSELGGDETPGIFKVRKGLTVSPESALELNEGIKLAFAPTVSSNSVKIDGVLIAASADSFYKIQVEGETGNFTLSGNGKVNIAGTEASPAAVTVQVVEVAVDDDLANSGNNDDIFLDNEGDGQYDGGISDGKITAKDFIFDFDGLSSTDTSSLEKGKPAGVLFLPKKDGPWTASLIENWGNSASFTLENSEDSIESALIADPDAYSAVKIMIAAEGGLEWGYYEAGVKITNGKTEINKKLTINVLETPAAPKSAPLVYPYITGVGKNKLGVNWKGTLPQDKSITGVKLYINTENNSGNAFLYGSYVTGSSEYTAAKAYITDLDGDAYDGWLPDGTAYYVWIKAYSSSGDGLFSPVRSVTTSYTIPEMFYKTINETAPDGSNNFFAWDSFYGDTKGTGDMYIIHPPGSNERIYPGGLLHYGQMHPSNGKSSGFRGDIVYFRIAQGIGAGTGKGKWGESLAGGYGGVFIIRYHDTYAYGAGHGNMYKWVNKRRYQAVFFYGMGVIQTVGPPTNTLGPDGNALGLEMGYFGNAYNLGGCNPEVDTFEQAFEGFKGPGNYIAYIATPWYHNFKPEASGKDPADYTIGKYDEQDYYYQEDGETPAIDWSAVDVAKPGYEDLTKVKF